MGRPFDIDRLFRRHRDELQRFAQRRLGDREAATDVVQDTFVRFAASVQDRGDAAAVANPRAFLFRTTHNLAVDALRHGQVAAGVVDQAGLADTIAAAEPSPETITLDRDRIRCLREALAQLPPLQRQVLVMKRLHGCSHAEIAARTGLSAAAAEKTLTRALKRLRELIGDAWP